MKRTLRRMAGLFIGYALAVVVASLVCCALFAGWAAVFRPGTLYGFFPAAIVSGIAITASTAWPGYLVTAWLLLSKKLANNVLIIGLAGALTAIQALLLISYFVATVAHFDIWLPAIIGGFIGAVIFSLAAENLFGMHLKQPSQSPSSSKS